MIETLGIILPIIIYALLIVLLVVIIVLGVKLIKVTDKINVIIDDFERKIESLNNIFNYANQAASKLGALSNKLIDVAVTTISKAVGVKNNIDDEDDY